MEIRISRHAKRRAQLYGIPEPTIVGILNTMEFQVGVHEIIQTVAGFEHPLKIVVSVGKDIITVVTNYPLKRGRRR